MEEKIDYNGLDYFMIRYGNVDRWARWEEQRPLIKAKHPELVDALERLNIARITLAAVYNQMQFNVDREDT